MANGKRVCWANITKVTHDDHELMARQIIDAINNGEVKSYGESTAMRARLLRSAAS